MNPTAQHDFNACAVVDACRALTREICAYQLPRAGLLRHSSNQLRRAFVICHAEHDREVLESADP